MCCIVMWFAAVVEEYVNKGDILNDCISHPDKYTERHVAVALAKPLLQALAHLHANNIIHRQVLRLHLEAQSLGGCCSVVLWLCLCGHARVLHGALLMQPHCDDGVHGPAAGCRAKLLFCIPAVLLQVCAA
jgi:hypothetical protein